MQHRHIDEAVVGDQRFDGLDPSVERDFITTPERPLTVPSGYMSRAADDLLEFPKTLDAVAHYKRDADR
ncbi:hypothetical protein [Lysobacter capsici]|uniref:hypothetical protein n=1 Tax=Lysobacter capsici TaxID=435897 RepID=UPI00287B7FB2|nr:hypothetical protein [Lysobacter capsici]WND80424.1 hypothetical protein RJ610_24640 [Lysobacter capsici]WND85621.1 hypothetical protein RJ609_24660 [Lysobacter capsici]